MNTYSDILMTGEVSFQQAPVIQHFESGKEHKRIWTEGTENKRPARKQGTKSGGETRKTVRALYCYKNKSLRMQVQGGYIPYKDSRPRLAYAEYSPENVIRPYNRPMPT